VHDERQQVTTTDALGSWGSFDLNDPFPLFAEVRKLGAVHRVTLVDGHDAWLVVRYEEAMAALNDPRLSKDMHAALAMGSDVVAEGLPGPDFARHMLTVDPPDHTRLRRLVSAAFSPRRVQALGPQVQTITDDLLDAIALLDPRRPVDLVSTFAFPLPFTVICELLGVPGADRPQLGREFTQLLVPTTTATEYAEAKKASDVVVAMLEALVAAKESHPGDDLVSALISARDGEERLTSQELLSTIFQLMVAGHDTTASLIGNSVAALFRNPEQLSTLRSDPRRVPAAIEEFLRYDAPVPHSTFRYTVEPFTIAGVTIPKGAQVVICMAAANRDDAKYVHPESLDLNRAVTRHLAFGHGVHHCLGAPLARLEGQVALGSLLRRFPQLTLAVPSENLRWGHGDGLVLRGLSELPVIPGPALPRPQATGSFSGDASTVTDQRTSLAGFLAAPPCTPEAQRLFDEDLKGLGYVMNTSRLWAHLPVALDKLSDLMGETTRAGGLSFLQRAVLVTAAASASGDSYCSMAWGKKLAEATSPDVAAGVIRGGTEGLDQAEAALARWAGLMAEDANAISADDVQTLRDVGFDDSQIFAITAYVAFRLAFSMINDTLGAVPDRELRIALPEAVRSAVAFGRLEDTGGI
jgi:cytochrome P450/alkylhydroperoxidase family enzyme